MWLSCLSFTEKALRNPLIADQYKVFIIINIFNKKKWTIKIKWCLSETWPRLWRAPPLSTPDVSPPWLRPFLSLLYYFNIPSCHVDNPRHLNWLLIRRQRSLNRRFEGASTLNFDTPHTVNNESALTSNVWFADSVTKTTKREISIRASSTALSNFRLNDNSDRKLTLFYSALLCFLNTLANYFIFSLQFKHSLSLNSTIINL